MNILYVNSLEANNKELRQQLADSQEQVTLLRDVLSDFDKAAINSKSIIGFAGQSFKLITKMRKALAATQDLSGLILCEAEPVRYIYKFLDDKGRTILSMNLEREGQIPIATMPLYQARTL